MTTVSVVTEIAAPVERVFQVFTDLEQSAVRVSNIRRIELVTVGSLKLGARWLETREVLGREDTAEMEITAYEQNRTYTITHHKAGARIDSVFTFTPNGQRDHRAGRIRFAERRAFARDARARALGDCGQGPRRHRA